jgi:hypothetical protein
MFAIAVGAFAEDWGTCPMAPPPPGLSGNKTNDSCEFGFRQRKWDQGNPAGSCQ